MIAFVVPIRTHSANAREHWTAKARRVKAERQATALVAGSMLRGVVGVVSVTFTRLGPRLMDCDNLAGSAKHVRDEVAKLLNVSDAPSGGVAWRYAQCKAKEYGVEVVVETTRDAEVREWAGTDGLEWTR